MANELIKNYSLDIDFLDYSKNKNISNNIVYSDADINSTFINATLYLQGEVINLTDCTVTVGVRDVDDNSVVNSCEIINALEGKIKIPFITSLLSTTSFNKFDICITKGDKKIVSPSFNFRVLESVTDDNVIVESPSYDILTILISKVDNLQKVSETLINDVSSLNSNITQSESTRESQEEIRKTNEFRRIDAENARISQESIRKSQEEIRKTAELSRVNNESARVSAENLRISQEAIRVEAEQSRVVVENSRVESEKIRSSQEVSRVESEKIRTSAENNRVNEENIRISNENKRQETFNSTMDRINTAIASGTNDLEVREARISINGTVYNTLNDRLNAIETNPYILFETVEG